MQVEWYGQSAFRLSADGTTVFIDPFGDVSGLASRGLEFEYPPIAGVEAELVLVTHEHLDHNAVEAIGGAPAVLRSTAGRLESRWVVPMHYRTERVNFVDTADAFLERMRQVHRVDSPAFDTASL